MYEGTDLLGACHRLAAASAHQAGIMSQVLTRCAAACLVCESRSLQASLLAQAVAAAAAAVFMTLSLLCPVPGREKPAAELSPCSSAWFIQPLQAACMPSAACVVYSGQIVAHRRSDDPSLGVTPCHGCDTRSVCCHMRRVLQEEMQCMCVTCGCCIAGACSV
jgi:hypothetical protein